MIDDIVATVDSFLETHPTLLLRPVRMGKLQQFVSQLSGYPLSPKLRAATTDALRRHNILSHSKANRRYYRQVGWWSYRSIA